MDALLAWTYSHFFVTFIDEWLSCLTYIRLSRRRRRGRALVLRSGLMFVAMAATSLLCRHATVVWGFAGEYWILARVAIFAALMILMIGLCSRESPTLVLYLGMRAFLLAELVWSATGGLIRDFPGSPLEPGSHAVVLAVAVVACGLLYLLERLFMTISDDTRISGAEVAIVILTCIIVLLLTTFSLSTTETLFGMDFLFAHALIDFLGIIFLFVYRLWFGNVQKQEELRAIRHAIEVQGAQLREIRGAQDAIHRKHHDIKYVISLLRSNSKDAERLKDRWIREMEEDLYTFEALSNTGNDVLDALLSERRLSCKKQGITLSCVVDGAQLEGMDALDVFTIFGNALDNAIEHTAGMEDPERRLIRLHVYRKQAFVVVSFENPCAAEPALFDGLPRSTKRDVGHHGFGLKSLRYVVEGYGGSLKISWRDGWFRLTFLLPLPLETRAQFRASPPAIP